MISIRLKITLTLVLTSIGLACGAGKISLTELPCTAMSRIWTQKGRKTPSINRNQLGHPIRIGGKVYAKGLVGHSGMSLVYNISGKATALEMSLGIDDEDFPGVKYGDKNGDMYFSIQVDRKEVRRQKVFAGQQAVPVRIDLRGATQFEIRALYGGHFLRQRAAVADPVIYADDTEELLRRTTEWENRLKAERLQKPEYPAAPGWKKISAEKILFHGFPNAYRFDAKGMEIVVVPECGGRIYSLCLDKGENLLHCNLNGKNWKLPDYGVQSYTGGFYTQPQPRNYFLPPDPFLNFGAYEINFPEEGEIRLMSPPSYVFFLRYEYRIRIDPEKRTIAIRSRHINLAPFPRKAGVWSIATVNGAVLRKVSTRKPCPNAPEPPLLRAGEFTSWITEKDGWMNINLPDDYRRQLGERKAVEYQSFPEHNTIRAFFDTDIFEMTFDVPRTAWKEMKEFRPAHVFIGGDVCELECHSPTRDIVSGGYAELNESWKIVSQDKSNPKTLTAVTPNE